MKTTIFASLIASAAAFAPSSQPQPVSVTALAATAAELEALPGKSTECGGKLFDPLELAQWAPATFLRKAELANGRVAMLANVGWFWPAIAGTFSSDDVTTLDPIKAILECDPQWWAQWILFCGLIEGAKYRAELNGKSYTGDGEPFLDYAGQWGSMDAKKKDTIRLQELKNGRLAMIGLASYLAAYFIPGSVPALSGMSF